MAHPQRCAIVLGALDDERAALIAGLQDVEGRDVIDACLREPARDCRPGLAEPYECNLGGGYEGISTAA